VCSRSVSRASQASEVYQGISSGVCGDGVLFVIEVGKETLIVLVEASINE